MTTRRPFMPIEVRVAGLLLGLAATVRAAEPRLPRADWIPGYGERALSFEANQGQTDSTARFVSRGPGYTLFLTPTEAVLALRQADRGTRVLRMKTAGANPAPTLAGVDALPGKSHYLIGNDPTKWRTGIPTYAKVAYRDVYPGVSLAYHGHGRQLEYDFVVAPGADAKAITLAFDGAEDPAIDARGDLVLDGGRGEIRMRRPVLYQDGAKGRAAIDGRFVMKDRGHVGFEVGAYDATRPLVIDPVLAYSTYLGGSGQDVAWAIAVDTLGNAYIAGDTSSLNFPTTAGAFDTSFNGFMDAFVTKLDPTGATALYSTYIGGARDGDTAFGIAVDAAGNAYVTGLTSASDFPTTPGAFDTTFNGGLAGGTFDAFVTKLDATGATLVYSTFLGGNGYDAANSIAVDSAGNAYVTGGTVSSNFPTTAGAFQTALRGSVDGFVTKLDAAGSALVYSTYLGGSDFDSSMHIALDSAGTAYVTGNTSSSDFPTTPGAFDTTYNGPFPGGDTFVTRIDAAGSALVYSTFLGGSNFDSARGLAVDGAGSAYVAGSTSSTDFPTTAGAFSTTLNGVSDAFVTKLNAAGSALVYSTFFGGSSSDAALALAVDASGQAHVTGTTLSTDLPTTPGTVQAAPGGTFDAFVVKLDAAGSAPVYSTYLGGSGQEQGLAIAVRAADAYVSGSTDSTNFPTTPGAFDPSFNGFQEGFVARIADAPVRPKLDHFTFYRVTARGHHGHFPPQATVTLEDQFGSLKGFVGRTRFLGNPSEKNHDGVVTPISQPEAHLVAVDVEPTRRTRHRTVEVTNQFGTEVLRVGQPDLLLVPSAKALVPATPGAIPKLLDHFLCYRVGREDDDKDDDRPRARVKLSDQFGTREADVGDAVRLCNPVRKTHRGVATPIGSPDEHLTCYEIEAGDDGPGRRSVNVRNQFGLEALRVGEARALCVPSSKRVLR